MDVVESENRWQISTGLSDQSKRIQFFEAVELLAEQANIQPPLSVSENIPMEKQKSCDTVRLFESAIVPLSYATLQKLDGKEWRREHLLSLAGVYQPAKEIEKSKVPAALARTLKMHPEVKTIVLHLDNDRIGRLATKAISTVLPKQYQIKDVPPKQGKDYNDQLCIKLNLAITKREKNTKKSMSGHEKYER